MLYVILLIQFVSIYFTIELWRSTKTRQYKILLTLILFLPFVGPIFYFFINDMPPSLPLHKQNRAHRGSYTDQWVDEKKKLKKKIKALEHENKDKSSLD